MTTRDAGAAADPATAYRAHLTDALEAAQAAEDPRLYLVACTTVLFAGAGEEQARATIAAEVARAMLRFYDVHRPSAGPNQAVLCAAHDVLRAALVAALSVQTLFGADAFAEVWQAFSRELVMEEPAGPH